MRLLGFLLLVVMITLSAASFSQAADKIRVTCTKDGRIVHREELSGAATQEQKMFIYAKNPDALCIFLRDAPSTDATELEVGIDHLVGGKVGGATKDNNPSNDLATALAIISSGGASPSSPIDLTDAMRKFRQNDPARTPTPEIAPTRLINLTIGIYRSVSATDIMDHWKAMQAAGTSLKNLTPTLTRVANITMLSVENIGDENANAICEDAAKYGSGCIAFY